MNELLATLAAWRAEGVDAGRGVVVRTFGSSPQREGAVLLVASDGRIAGSVSGGCVEAAVADEVARARDSGTTRVIRYGISDEAAWDVGLACGGTIDVLVEPRVPDDVVAAAQARGTAVVTVLPGDGSETSPKTPLVVDATGGIRGSLGSPDLDAQLVAVARAELSRGRSRTIELGGRELFIESFPVRPRLVIVGAVHTAMSLVAFARELGFTTVVVDGRSAFATRDRFPDVDRLVVGWPDDVADEISLGPDDAVVVLTHDPKFDEPAIVEALRRDCRYVGAIGSRRTQADRRERLRRAGVGEAELGRLRSPIGLDLGGRSPAETALAIIAEVVADRYDGSAKPLRELAPDRAVDDARQPVGAR